MKNVLSRLIGVLVLAACCANAYAQLQGGEDEIVDEVVVTGTPPDGFGFATVGGWLSFAVIDLGNVFGAQMSLSQALNQFNDAANQASEQMCQNKIEAWRQECHDTYSDFQPVCIASGLYSGLSLINSIIPAIFRGAAGTASGTVTSMGCMQLTQRAHLWCENIANSDAAPDIAECD